MTVSRVTDNSNRSALPLEEIADVTEKDGVITIRPRKIGESELVLRAESNGRETYAYVPVSVSVNSGIGDIAAATRTISIIGDKVILKGFDGETFIVTDLAGAVQSSFRPIKFTL